MDVKEASAKYRAAGEVEPTGDGVPVGFKRSEVGMIPQDWNEVSLISLAGGSKDRFDDGDWIEAEYLAEGGIRLIQTGNIGVGRFIDKVGRKYISSQSFEKLRCKDVFEGDLLVCRLAEPAGRACIVPRLDDARAITAVDVTIFRPLPEVAEDRFLLQYFSTNQWLSAVDERCGGSTRSRIARGTLGRMLVPLPPDRAEQRAVADALSDADTLIESLQQLIAKKRAVKQGAMRPLLTGKERLPGFSDEWKQVPFADVVRHHSGNSTLIKGKLPSSPSVGLYPGFSASGQDVWCEGYEHEGNAFVVSAVGSRCGKAFMATGKWSAIANTHVIWPDRAKVDDRYLGYFINDEEFWIKSGSGQPFVRFNASLSKQLALPSIREQAAIATVLSDMDAEIDALEARLAKTRDLKAGMMQALLTGRIRLPLDEAA